MLITILNGEPDAGSEFDAYVQEYAAQLEVEGHDVTTLDLRDLDIKGCTGCWGCWVKTPGECARKDESARVCTQVLASDLTVLASPVHMGFTSSLLKRTADQMIPLVHPYFTIEGGEQHHRARYARYPLFGLVLGPTDDTDAEDLEITEHLWSRMARNIKTRVAFTTIATTPVKEATNELAAVA
ncbi:MAG: flavodoxin family protein [Coriobacteriia bacterium]|nr:flavodoxin family protein [Coriobacteriia bacterium]